MRRGRRGRGGAGRGDRNAGAWERGDWRLDWGTGTQAQGDARCRREGKGILALDRVTIARMDAVVKVGFHAISRPVQA